MKQIVYVASPESQQIHAWQLDDQGALTLLQTLDVPGQVQPMVLHPHGHHLYAGVRPTFGIISYSIAQDGTLQQAGMAPLPASPTHISTDLEGRYLFSASYSGNCASISMIGPEGRVTAPIQQIDDLNAPHSANIDPANLRLLLPCLKEDRIRVFNLSDTGGLTPHHPQAIASTEGAGPRHMAFHPNAHYAYCVNELDGTVDVLAITDNGSRYARIQTEDLMPAGFTGTRWAADIHLTPQGNFLYVSERSASILTIFRVADDGSNITLVGHQPTEAQPRGFNLDHSGRFVIVAGQKSDHIAVYQIDPSSGKLTLLARYPVGRGPMWITVLASDT